MEKCHIERNIQMILDEIKSLKQSQLYLRDFIEQLRLLKKSYAKNTVLELFKRHPELYRRCQLDAERGLNVDYLADVLPNEISDGTQGFFAMRSKNLDINKALHKYIEQIMLDVVDAIEKIDTRIKANQAVILEQWEDKKYHQPYQNVSSKITLETQRGENIRSREHVESKFRERVVSRVKVGPLFQALEDISTRLFMQTTRQLGKSSSAFSTKRQYVGRHLNTGNARLSRTSPIFFNTFAIEQQRENIKLLNNFNLKDSERPMI